MILTWLLPKLLIEYTSACEKLQRQGVFMGCLQHGSEVQHQWMEAIEGPHKMSLKMAFSSALRGFPLSSPSIPPLHRTNSIGCCVCATLEPTSLLLPFSVVVIVNNNNNNNNDFISIALFHVKHAQLR